MTKKSLAKNWLKWPVVAIALYALVGFFNSLIANDNPLVAGTQNGICFPAFNDMAVDWGLMSSNPTTQTAGYRWTIYPPIRYKAGTIDKENAGFKSPVTTTQSSGHWLGTDQLGRDVAAGIVRGCYTSFRIGLLATLFCALIGIMIGMAMGYFGNKILKVNLAQALVLVVGLLLTCFFGFYSVYPFSLHPLFFWALWIIAGIGTIVILSKTTNTANLKLPIDAGLSRVIEWRRSVPTLILLLVLFPLFEKPAVNNVILVILLLGWTGFARHARAETMSIKERQYVVAARIMGASHLAILRRHILPNILHTLLILAAMNFAGNILLESTLSFLGMGLPPDEVSWGSLLSEGRKNHHAWWLVVFPGLALFILVYSINRLTDQYLEKDA